MGDGSQKNLRGIPTAAPDSYPLCGTTWRMSASKCATLSSYCGFFSRQAAGAPVQTARPCRRIFPPGQPSATRTWRDLRNFHKRNQPPMGTDPHR